MQQRPLGRLAAEFRHRVPQHVVDHAALVARKALLELAEPGADRLERRLHRLCRDDAGNADLAGFLLARKQNLVQALTRTNAGELDFDVAPRLEPAEADDA